MSQQKRRFEASAKHCRLFQKHKPLCAPGREWGAALRAGSSSTGSTKSESNLSVGFPNPHVWALEMIRARSEPLLAASPASYYGGYVGVAEIYEKRDERFGNRLIDGLICFDRSN